VGDGRGISEGVVMPHPIAWERQIGPCCGLAALRMARAALRRRGPPDAAAAAAPPPPPPPTVCWGTVELALVADAEAAEEASVLEAAISRGFSTDGELFDIHDLAALAADVCGLHAWVLSTATPPSAEAASPAAPTATGAMLGEQIAEWFRRGGLAIVPYDKGEANHGPVERGGRNAHYAVLVAAAPLGEVEEAQEVAGGRWRLIGLHGLSRQPLVVSPDELARSNAQLVTMKKGVGTASWTVKKETGIRLAGRVLLVA